ncbi:hypothetical protein C8Q76DRAFT_616931 [Earliella scabrosa]|nr:hypothetical protein C8Q76DRAFT_616931 [Earliella scabrosa]
MPAADSKRKEHDSVPDSSRDGGDRDRERDKDKGPKHKSSTKTKDLSHVPCKFFKVGSCTAGSSCPFSHQVLEPGQAKEVCAWFVKGNCKFGHKCALAHVLPGQSMSMDRKNKKAAQLAAGGGSAKDGPKSKPPKGSHHPSQHGPQSRNALLSGSTAPTRSLPPNARSPIPMPLKATLSPSAPAPPVKDTDFASFGLPDESNKLPVAPAHGKPSSATTADNAAAAQSEHPPKVESTNDDASAQPDRSSPSPLPTHTTSAPRRISDATPAADLGPIGSPPRASSSSSRPARINGFSPGTSPQPHGLSSSPFSAPGTQTVFTVSRHDDVAADYKSRSGLSASLGAGMNWGSERVMVHRMGVEEVVVEDEDLEEFIPSSLTDLLTPEERSRRMSRTNATRPTMVGLEREPSAQRSGTEAHHRYSRSVPAPSLLQDIKSIWSDAGGGPVGSPDASALGAASLGGGLGNGTPSSFTSNQGLGSRTVEDMLSPSNASAAFLPGLHHYINNKPQRPPMVSGLSSMYPGGPGPHTLSTSAYGHEFSGVAMSPPHTSTYGTHHPNDTYLQHAGLRPSGRPIPGGDAFAPGLDEQRSALSPSSRALQAHAPGQSLPQGLAAGYSRIHALPPPVIPSPSSSSILSRTPLGGGFSPGTKGLGHGHSTSGDWASMSPTAGSLLDQINNGPPPSGNSLGGLETMFSRLSYSAAASRNAAPPGMGTRNPSGRGPHPQGSLSPLSGPVLTGEDDDLFAME